MTEYSKTIVRLLKGHVNKGSTHWENILIYRKEIDDYLSVIGLSLIVKEGQDYAFLKQIEDDDGKTMGVSQRRDVGYEVSIVLVVLREALLEFESNSSNLLSTRKNISFEEIEESVKLFLPEGYNDIKLLRNMDGYIKRVIDLGYLNELNEQNETRIQDKKYSIHPIIKEKVSVDVLNEFKEKIKDYAESI